MAGFDKVDPANLCFLCSAGHICAVAHPAHDHRVDRQPCRKKQAPELDDAIPVVGKYALQKRAGAANKLRVVTS